MKQRLTILGATGSVGVSTLDVVARHPDRFEVFALSAARQVDLLLPRTERPEPEPLEQQAVEILGQRQLVDHGGGVLA